MDQQRVKRAIEKLDKSPGTKAAIINYKKSKNIRRMGALDFSVLMHSPICGGDCDKGLLAELSTLVQKHNLAATTAAVMVLDAAVPRSRSPLADSGLAIFRELTGR